MEAVEQFGGCPRIVRTDLGTENVVVRDIQTYLRCSDVNSRSGEQSYIAGVSTSNQRIESWWGMLRKEGMECWIQLLCKMKDEGLFVGDYLDKSLVQLCFRNIIHNRTERGREAVREKVGDILLLEHAITHGDNLNKLALQYGCKVADLKCVNNLMQEQDLYALKSVKIPVKKHSLLTEAPSLIAPATPPRSLAPCPEGYADFLKEIDHIERLAKGRGVQQGLLSDTPEGPLRTGTGQATPNHSADWGIQWWTTVALMLLVEVILPLFYVVYYRTQNGSADTLGDGMGNISLSTSDATLTNISASPRKRVSQILNRPLA
ncbi:lysM and putative peptidoglycan-binding domain-containing protein 4-like [Anguilla rostrata]|uniref:lysM and putative peptidoglycan-binding domain-containing protein 4-like n=1 Tax=Anguilla rostrata TaxID=7938 RepID=UPI0030D0C99E